MYSSEEAKEFRNRATGIGQTQKGLRNDGSAALAVRE